MMMVSFSAHTKESARALANTIEMAFPKARLVLVVAMANDKDHLGFAKELLSGLTTSGIGKTNRSTAGCASPHICLFCLLLRS